MHQEEDSIYSLNIINNGALLEKDEQTLHYVFGHKHVYPIVHLKEEVVKSARVTSS